MVIVEEPITNVTLETPADLVSARVKVENGKVKEVFFNNVPSFLYKKDVSISVPSIGEVKMDISFGGNFFAIVNSAYLGVEISTENTQKLTEIGMEIIKAVNEQVEIKHPNLPHIKQVELCEIYGPPKGKGSNMQNIVVFGKGQIDRSPCGTGTSAKLATLYSKGELGMNEEFVYESIIETKFKGRVIQEIKVGEFDAVICEITGSAFITGYNQMFIDSEDSVKYGFSIK